MFVSLSQYLPPSLCLFLSLFPSVRPSPRLISITCDLFIVCNMQEPARASGVPSNVLQNLQSTQAPRSPSTQAPSAAASPRAVPQPRAKLIEMDAEEAQEAAVEEMHSKI